MRRGARGLLLMINPRTRATEAAQGFVFARTGILRPLSDAPRRRRSIATKMSNESQSSKLDAIFNQKRTLRSTVREALKAMEPTQRSHEDNAIQRIILEAPWFKSSQRLCAYICSSALREVDTSKVLSEFLENLAEDGDKRMKKKLYVPRVEDRKSHMRMLSISSLGDLIANSMNILEPAPVDENGNEREDVMQANDPVDLFLLPGLAFDRSGGRLGRGGGYFDSFLKKYQDLAEEKNWKQPLLVALSYSSQIKDEGVIPMTSNDVYVDAIVSPEIVIPISPAAAERMKHGLGSTTRT